MKKSSGLDFTHKPQKRSSGALVAAIAVGVLIIGAVSFIILLAVNDFDTAKFLGMRISDETAAQNPTQTDESEISETAPEFSDTDAVNFLFVCHNSAELSFCSVLSASVKENSLKIKAIAPDMTAQINGEKTTVAEAFRRKGISGVKEILASRGIETAKYVSVTETNFKLTVGTLGATEIDLPRDIAFTDGGVKYTFSAGKNTFTADLLLKLIKYGDTGDGLTSLQALAEAAVVRKNLTQANFGKGADFFSTLINRVDTDITAFDYSASSAAIEAFILASPSTAAIG